MLEGIITSDWHLMGLKKHFTRHVEYTFAEIDKIYNYAVSEGVSNIIVAGDISDSPILSYDCYIALLQLMKKYDGRIDTHYICGNHDFHDNTTTSMDLLATLQELDLFSTFHLYMEPTQKTIDGTVVNFLPFPCLESIPNKMPCLNISHVSYNGAIGDNGRKLRIKNEFIQDARDFNVSGHIHQHQVMETKRAAYCGNPYQKNFGEKLPKGFMHFKAEALSEDAPLKFGFKFINNQPDIQLLTKTITAESDLLDLKKSDKIRYKLIIADEMAGGSTLPSYLFSDHHNIADIVYASQVSEKLENEPTGTYTAEQNVRKGLTNFLKSMEFDKYTIKEAHCEVKNAMLELNL